MDIQFAKYKELIEQQLEELTAEDVRGQSAQKTVELDQQSVGRLSRMDALQSQAIVALQTPRCSAVQGLAYCSWTYRFQHYPQLLLP